MTMSTLFDRFCEFVKEKYGITITGCEEGISAPSLFGFEEDGNAEESCEDKTDQGTTG